MDKETDKLARWLKVLSVGTRLRVVRLLNGRALCVNALTHRLSVTQSAVSQHLRVLREAGPEQLNGIINTIYFGTQ